MAEGFFQTGELGYTEGRREQMAPDPRKIPPEVLNLTISEADTNDIDGSIPLRFFVEFQRPRWWGQLAYDVYARNDTDADPVFKHLKRITGPDAIVAHPYLTMIGSTYTFAVVAVSSSGRHLPPEDSATDTVTPGALGPEVPDVTGFDVTIECCDLLFTWTPLSVPYIEYYEIRQGVDFSTGTFVTVAGPSTLGHMIVSPAILPLALSGSGLDFHIKARSRTRSVGLTEASDTLTAAELISLQTFCCLKTRELTLTPGSDLVSDTTVTPGLPGVPPIINVNPRNAGAGGRTIFGAVDATSVVPNGLFYDYTIQLSDLALAGELIYVTESVRLH